LVAALGLFFGLDYGDGRFWAEFVLGRGLDSPLAAGFFATLYFTAITVPIGVVVGFFWGWARSTSYRFLSWPVTVMVEFLRGVPPLVLVIFAFLFGGAMVGRSADQFQAGLALAAVAIGFHTAAYQSEIFRAGFQSVPRGQVEAAHAVGMSGAQTMRHIVLPQAMRLSLPPLGNEFANTIKDTSLLAAIGATELFAQGLEFSQVVVLRGLLAWWLLIWITVGAMYFVLTFAVTRGLRALERRLRVPGLQGAAS
jgi:polar amino acid transport system permease protein